MTVPCELAPDRKARGSAVVDLPITTRISLAAGVPRVDIHTEIDNRARDHRLRVHFCPSAQEPISTGISDRTPPFPACATLPGWNPA
jgi:hypothetical protein